MCAFHSEIVIVIIVGISIFNGHNGQIDATILIMSAYVVIKQLFANKNI